MLLLPPTHACRPRQGRLAVGTCFCVVLSSCAPTPCHESAQQGSVCLSHLAMLHQLVLSAKPTLQPELHAWSEGGRCPLLPSAGLQHTL